MKILGISGSLRKGSFNTGALRAAQQLAPEGVQIDVVTLNDIPPFNQDLESDLPASVIRLKDAIRAADAILISTPEYNYSVPGVLKNAIDWASRPFGQGAWFGKPVAIMGASPGAWGTARAQSHLRFVLTAVGMHPLNSPEVLIAGAAQRFDDGSNLTDEKTREFIGAQIKALVAWAERLKAKS